MKNHRPPEWSTCKKPPRPWSAKALVPVFFLVLASLAVMSCHEGKDQGPSRAGPVPANPASLRPTPLWIPVVTDEQAFTASGCPWNGRGITEKTGEEWRNRINRDLGWHMEATRGPMLAGIFGEPYWPGTFVLIREPGEDLFFESSMTLALADQAGRMIGSLEASAYAQGESGGWYTQSWLIGPGPDTLPLLLRRGAGFTTPGPHNESTETLYWNSFSLLVHQGSDWHLINLPDLDAMRRLFPMDDPPSFCADDTGE